MVIFDIKKDDWFSQTNHPKTLLKIKTTTNGIMRIEILYARLYITPKIKNTRRSHKYFNRSIKKIIK